jgi:hypothetical protein
VDLHRWSERFSDGGAIGETTSPFTDESPSIQVHPDDEYTRSIDLLTGEAGLSGQMAGSSIQLMEARP